MERIVTQEMLDSARAAGACEAIESIAPGTPISEVKSDLLDWCDSTLLSHAFLSSDCWQLGSPGLGTGSAYGTPTSFGSGSGYTDYGIAIETGSGFGHCDMAICQGHRLFCDQENSGSGEVDAFWRMDGAGWCCYGGNGLTIEGVE